MQYCSCRPAPPLREFVHGFWHSTYTPSQPRVRILPSGTIELVVNLSEDQIRVYDFRNPKTIQCFPGIVVAGAYAGALDIDPMQHASMMGIHFRPGGGYPFFGVALRELVNSHLSLELLWGSAATELREKLCSATTPQQRFQILEQSLCARLHQSTQHPAVSLALDMFGVAGTGGSVKAVANRVGLSQRRFIQVFGSQIGLTPKLFCRVMRFNHVLESVERATKPNWCQMATDCGYVDQSHLIRDFQGFCGLSPADYLCLPSNRRIRSHIRLIS